MEIGMALVAGLVIGGGLVALVFSARVREAQARLATQEGELAALREEKSALAIRCAQLATELEKDQALFAERQATLEAARDSFADAFKVISADALAKNNQSFLELARATLEAQQAAALASARSDLDKRQLAIGELVAPVKTSLEKFEQQIQGIEKSRIDAYATLTEQVRAMAEAQGALRLETGNLVKALRAPQTRGRWGELQLKRVVEMAGMLDHCDFFEQESTDHRRRPAASRHDRQAARRQEHRGRCQGAAGRLPRSPGSDRRGGEEAQARRPRAPGARPPEEARPASPIGNSSSPRRISSCCSCPARCSTRPRWKPTPR